jgi:hypothetical protein
MAIQLPPEALINPDAPPFYDMSEALQNRLADFIFSKSTDEAIEEPPKLYVYLNSRFWREAVDAGISSEDREVWTFLRVIRNYDLEPVTHDDIPYNAMSVYDEYYPPGEIARRLKAAASDPMEFEAKGLISTG